MASGAKSFVLNREDDWKYKSVLSKVNFENDVFISDNTTGENSVYISQAFDSCEFETVWHRLRLDADIPHGGILKLRLYASDEMEVLAPGTNGKGMSTININEYFADSRIDVNRKIDVLDYIGAKVYKNPNDVLMFDLKGRYLWVCIEIINHGNAQTKISKMKIEFPRITFTDYLPEIYKGGMDTNSFISRFIGVFQSIYVDLEDRIDVTPIQFDTQRTNKDFLDWIASWLSVKDASIWGEEKLRVLIKESVRIYKMKGTKKAIAKIVEEYTGVEPIIVEQFDVKNNEYYERKKSHVEGLYGDNGYYFSVILGEEYVRGSEEYLELLRVINNVKPVDSICNLVVLTNKIYLDYHCYMGMNSYIAKNYEMVIGEDHQDSNTLILVDAKEKN